MIAVTISDRLLCFAAVSADESVGESVVMHAFA